MGADGAKARIGGASIEDTTRANVMKGTAVMTMAMAGGTTKAAGTN